MTEQATANLRTECVEWEKHRLPNGYGRQWHKGKMRYAHRLAYCEAHGLELDDIEGKVVRHKCDNPSCVNPAHLELGTHADNSRDMVKRGRSTKGEEHPNAKFTEQDVLDILAEHVRGCSEHGTAALALKYDVSPKVISDIVNGRSWAHVCDGKPRLNSVARRIRALAHGAARRPQAGAQGPVGQ